MLSNLTTEQHDDNVAYDGSKKEAEHKLTTNQTGGLELSERFKRKQSLKEVRR